MIAVAMVASLFNTVLIFLLLREQFRRIDRLTAAMLRVQGEPVVAAAFEAGDAAAGEAGDSAGDSRAPFLKPRQIGLSPR